uniref:Uncharacterized protein n=1 Tax=Cannabis sativa TaxID=3483 RepID=A0A803R9X0_CANSA
MRKEKDSRFRRHVFAMALVVLVYQVWHCNEAIWNLKVHTTETTVKRIQYDVKNILRSVMPKKVSKVDIE